MLHLRTYVLSLFHPDNAFAALEDETSFTLAFWEALVLSWICFLVGSVLSWFSFSFLLGFLENSFPSGSLFQQLTQFQKTSLSMVMPYVLGFFFFPLGLLVINLLWGVYLFLMLRLYGVEREDLQQRIKSLLAVSLSSHFFVLFPFIGGFLSKVAWFFLVHVGLKRHFKLSGSGSLMILLLPTMLLLFGVALVVYGLISVLDWDSLLKILQSYM